MTALENIPVEFHRFKPGSVEEVERSDRAANLHHALASVRKEFADAAFVRCCEHEADGGCVFVYATSGDRDHDEQDFAESERSGQIPASYGRWIGVISSAERDQPTCERPSSHGA